jgi:hypothetical protein
MAEQQLTIDADDLGGSLVLRYYVTATVIAWVCEIRALYQIKYQASETNLLERLYRSHGATRREPQ